MNHESCPSIQINADIAKLCKETQTDVTEVEHKYVQEKPSTRVKGLQYEYKVPKKNAQVSCNISVIQKKVRELSLKSNAKVLDSTVDSISSSNLDSSFSTENTQSKTSSTDSDLKLLEKEEFKNNIYLRATKVIIEDSPLLMIGIPSDLLYVVDLLNRETKIPVRNIYMTLKKLRQNVTYAVLGHEFGVSESQASRIFRSTISPISKCLKQLIFCPKRSDILRNLPISFRFRYSEVTYIIDCLEIEIEKPKNALHQAITWSSYKKCNTAKLLICVSPDGLILFISQAYGGRATDVEIVKNSGFLDFLPENSTILADRGFKSLESILTKKKCKIIRPPSVAEGEKSSKEEVKLTKQVASLRIHVERVIQRIRHFKFLDSHARIKLDLLDCLDNAVTIAAALVNLQSEVIKQI